MHQLIWIESSRWNGDTLRSSSSRTHFEALILTCVSAHAYTVILAAAW